MPHKPPDAAQQERELEGARREVRTLVVWGMRPNLSPQDRELIRNLERSARAEVMRALALARAAGSGPGRRPHAAPAAAGS